MSGTPVFKEKVTTLSLQTSCGEDPLTLFYHLTESGTQVNTMLLESSEITSKQAQKSILVLSSALRIVCQGQRVTIEALNANGRNALKLLLPHLPNQASHNESACICEFAASNNELNETERLQASSPIDVLRTVQTTFSKPDNEYSIFLAGNIAYDFIETFEKLPDGKSDASDCPNFIFYLAETLVVIEHKTFQSQVLGNVFQGTDAEAIFYDKSRRLGEIKASLQKSDIVIEELTNNQDDRVSVDIEDQDFASIVDALKAHIVAGDVFQIVPSRTFSVSCTRPLSSYQCLRALNPSPYMFYIQDQDFCLFGASPESAVKYQAHDRQVEVYPIAGTRPRGLAANGKVNLDLDTRIEAELRMDEKELTEHMMLVDLARNDIARITEVGTRHVKDLLKVDRYSHVMHLVSRVVGKLKGDLDTFHAYLACMNMGTLVGAPKIKAAQLLRQVEKKRRGAYGGAVGYINAHGSMDSCIVIRSALVKDNIAYVKAGAGVVYDSIPEREVAETKSKAQAVIKAIQMAHGRQA